MTERCFDEGTIQAFLDGELATDLLENVARHTALCDKCALMLAEAEEESAFAFSALESEFNTLVPTERIRTGLYDAISQIERPRKSLWKRIFGDGFSLANPSVMAFASLLLVFGLFTTLFIYRESQNLGDNQLAAVNDPTKTTPVTRKTDSALVEPAKADETKTVDSSGDQPESVKVQRPIDRPSIENQPTIQKANFRIERTSTDNRTPKADPRSDSGQSSNNETLLGEESYVKTIATLSDSVNNRKDAALRPSERVAFEKDLAVVDDAISKMQKEVRKNPKNEAAKQVLRSSYQNKIDLLNSVAEKTELMATR